MHSVPVSRFLRKVLLADAGVSAVAGLVMCLGGAALQSLLRLPGELLMLAGVSLLPYAALLAWLAGRAALPRAVLWVLALGNIAWLAGCALLAVGPWSAPSSLGQAFLGFQGLAVLVFAELYISALRRARSGLGRPERQLA